MLKAEQLKGNSNLSELTEEQLNIIVSMSKIDEENVIREKEKEYSQKIESATGLKTSGELSSWLDGEFKTTLTKQKDSLSKITEYETKISELEQKIKDGAGDQALKDKVKDYEDLITGYKTKISDLEKDFQTEKETSNQTLVGMMMQNDIAKGVLGNPEIKFKPSDLISDGIRDAVLKAAETEILSTAKPSIEELNGKKVLVFRDEKGEIMRGDDLHPKTYSSMLLGLDSVKGLLETGKQQGGNGGGGQESGGGNGGGQFSLQGVKNQNEANDMISQHLVSQGFVPSSPEFAEKSTEIAIENNVLDLPIQ